jgi:hypothetical protein
MQVGKLCVAQQITYISTKVVCQEFKPECVQTVTETKMLVPQPGNTADLIATSQAACKLLGYTYPGSGSVHMVGESPGSVGDSLAS